jgi:hypothetical protein
MIPGELFAREWFRPYQQDGFAAVLADIARGACADALGVSSRPS